MAAVWNSQCLVREHSSSGRGSAPCDSVCEGKSIYTGAGFRFLFVTIKNRLRGSLFCLSLQSQRKKIRSPFSYKPLQDPMCRFHLRTEREESRSYVRSGLLQKDPLCREASETVSDLLLTL